MRNLFKEIGESIPYPAKMILCGGASIILSTNHRETTTDVDYLFADPIVLDKATEICKANGYDPKILNDDVKVTKSYSARLDFYKAIYLQFGNLTVYTLQDIALLCMKLKSFRDNSHDYEDCVYLIDQCKSKGMTIEDVYTTLNTIYQSNSQISVEAEKLLKDKFSSSSFILDTESLDSYVAMLEDGIIMEDEIPDELREQVIRHRNKSKTDAMLFAAISSLNPKSK